MWVNWAVPLLDHLGSFRWLLEGWWAGKSKMASFMCLAIGAGYWLKCLSSLLHDPSSSGMLDHLPCISFSGQCSEKEKAKLQDLLRPRPHNFHITSTTFCYSEQVTGPAQVQGAGDIDSTSRWKVLPNPILKVSAHWDGKTLWPLNNLS